MNVGRTLLLSVAFGLLSGVTQAQAPTPAQMGITTATPNAVQVLDSSKTWATIGTVNPATHLFSPAGVAGVLPPLVSSFNTRIGAVTLSSSDVTGALGFTPYDAANPANYIAAAGAPVQSVAGRTGAVTLTHSDITDWATALTPYALLNSPAFIGIPTAPTPSPGDSTTKIATTAFVGAAITAGGYILPPATPTVLGGVKPDGTTITVDGGGVISGTPSGITANSTPTSGYTAGQLLVSDGAKTQATAITTSNQTDAGIFYTPPYGGMAAFSVSWNSYQYGILPYIGLPSTAALAWWIDNGAYNRVDLSLFHDGPGILADRTLTSPQTVRVYNTFTDASNGEWGVFDWQTTPNVLTIGSQANGTGTQRPIKIVSNGFGGLPAYLDYNVTAGGFWTINGYYGLAPPNSSSQYLGTSGRRWYQVFADGFVTGPSELPGVSCPAGQVSVSTNGIVTTCAAPTYPYTVAGTVTSGGIPFFSSATQISSSAVLANNAVMIGKGAGAAPATTTTPTASAFISNGTKPTNTTGTCPGSSSVGGATAGTFALVGICAAAGTVILTALPAATTGYACDMEDRVTRAATIVQSAATTTSATFIMGGTPSVANDVFQWKCIGY